MALLVTVQFASLPFRLLSGANQANKARAIEIETQWQPNQIDFCLLNRLADKAGHMTNELLDESEGDKQHYNRMAREGTKWVVFEMGHSLQSNSGCLPLQTIFACQHSSSSRQSQIIGLCTVTFKVELLYRASTHHYLSARVIRVPKPNNNN